MAHSFKSSTGGKTFKVFAESSSSGVYTYNKKARASYCIKNKCPINVNVGSQGNRILFNNAFLLNANKSKCIRTLGYDNTELYINLISKLDLSGNLPIVTDLSGQAHPVSIDASNNPLPPYLTYDIDPSGVLFGDTICGINNFVRFMVYDVSYNTHALASETSEIPVAPIPVAPIEPVTPTPVIPTPALGQTTFTLVGEKTQSIDIQGALTQESYKDNNITPENIVSISVGTNVNMIERSAFIYTTMLSSITVDSANAYLCSDNGVLFDKLKNTLIYYPVKNSRPSYAIPPGVISIGDYAFTGAQNLITVDIPNSVTSIGTAAFAGAVVLTSLSIPANVETLSEFIVANSPMFNTITFASNSILKNIGTSVFQNLTQLKSFKLPASVKFINQQAFTSSGLTSVIFETSSQLGYTVGPTKQSFFGAEVTIIAGYSTGPTGSTVNTGPTGPTVNTGPTGNTTFALLDGTTQSINISGQLNQQSYSSVPVNNIKSVSVGSNVTSIGQQSFQNTTRLTSVTLPASVTSVGSNVFLGSGLTTVVFESTSNIESLGFKISNVPQLFYGKTVFISPTKTAVSSALNQAQRQLNLDITALDAANAAYNKANTEVLDAEHSLLNAEIDYNIASHNLAQTNHFSFNYQTVYYAYLSASKKKEEANQRVTTANNDLTKAQQTKTAAEQAKTQAQTRLQTLTDAQSWAV